MRVEVLFMDTKASNIQEWIEKSWNAKEMHRFIKLQGMCVYCEKKCAQQSDENGVCTVHCINITIIWSKRCALHNGYFHSLQLSYFLSTTMTECLQSSSMLRLNRLQWVAPTHQPQNHQNRAHTVQANPLRRTLWKDSLCFSFARAHLLSVRDIVVITVGLCIYR